MAGYALDLDNLSSKDIDALTNEALRRLPALLSDSRSKLELLKLVQRLQAGKDSNAVNMSQFNSDMGHASIELLQKRGFVISQDEKGRVVISDLSRQADNPIVVVEQLKLRAPELYSRTIAALARANKAYALADRLNGLTNN